MPGGADQGSVGLRDEQLLRKFVACRDAGDGDGALHWWGRLAEANLDRVRGMVDVRASRYGLSADEREEAVQRALVKLWHKMVATFRGATMGEWVNATKQLVEFVCMDVQRRAAKQSARETSLDTRGDDSDDDGADWLGDELALQCVRAARRSAPTRPPSSPGRCRRSPMTAGAWCSSARSTAHRRRTSPPSWRSAWPTSMRSARAP